MDMQYKGNEQILGIELESRGDAGDILDVSLHCDVVDSRCHLRMGRHRSGRRT